MTATATTVDETLQQRVVSETSLDQYELPKCRIPPPEKLDPVLAYVSSSIQEQHDTKKDDTVPLPKYKGILDAMRTKQDTEMLHMIFLALKTGNTLSLITKTTSKHARLIHSLFKFDPFLIKGEADAPFHADVVDAYLYLLIAIVSNNTVFLVPAITSLWKFLTQSTETDPTVLTERAQRIHATFRVLVRLCPKSKNELFTAMCSHAPFRLKSKAELDWYYTQCLEVVHYNPAITAKVLELMIDKCLEMDVEIRIDDGGGAVIESDDNDTDVAELFEMDMYDTPKPKKEPLSGNPTVDEMADKLDSLMHMLFSFVHNRSSEWLVIRQIYDVFARSFESSILTTHKSKFVQFLLLYVCGVESGSSRLDPDVETLDREFATKLIHVVVDPFQATSTRQTAACYLASFISRARFVSAETVCEAVNALLKLAEAYLQSLTEFSIHAPDSRDQCSLHSLFYTVCQSAFYIICFRGREAIEFYESRLKSGNPEHSTEHIDIGSKRWIRVCSHPLQPLRYCLESVRSEFLHLCQIYSLMDTVTLQALMLEDEDSANRKRVRTAKKIKTAATSSAERRTGGVGGLGKGKNPLDSFFPFDPYLLRDSHKFLEPFYRHWSELIDEVSMDEDDFDEDEDASENETASDAESDGDSDSSDDEESSKQHMEMVNPGSLLSTGSISSRSNTMFVGTADSLMSSGGVGQEGMWDGGILSRARAQSIENGSW